MRVEFDSTVDDLVDVTLRSQSSSPFQKSTEKAKLIDSGIIYGLFTWLVVLAIVQPQHEMKWICLFFCLIFMLIVYPLYHRWYVKRFYRLYFREFLDKTVPFRVIVELTPSGIVVQQPHSTSMVDWKNITSLHDTPDALYISGTFGWMMAVRTRAFGGQEAKKQFIKDVESHMAAARNDR